jgi:hypothetical protein
LGIFFNQQEKENNIGAGPGFWPKATVPGRGGLIAC